MLFLAAAIADVWAMPWPIRPRPMMPSLSKLLLEETMGVAENWRITSAALGPLAVKAHREKDDASMI